VQRTLGIVVAIVVLVGVGHLALIEVGREVVTLRTPRAEGGWQETRLWIVDQGEGAWLHSAGEDWLRRFEGEPVVEVERGGAVRRYRARAVPGPHPEVDRLLRAKYGVADRWVRLLAPCDASVVPVRLEPLGEPTAGEG
jgi:hypothetical protein